MCTRLKGWAVAARRRAQIAALRGEALEFHTHHTSTTIRGKGGAPDTVVRRNIPKTYADLVRLAAKDSNKIQSKLNVHEDALAWIRIYEESKQDKNTRRRLLDLLLPGTSAVYTAIPSSPAMQLNADELAFRIRMQFGLETRLCGFFSRDAYELAMAMAAKERNEKHDWAREALLEAAVASNVVACREPERHFQCHNGTGVSVTPDGVLILEDGTVVGLDVCYAATPAAGKAMIDLKRWGRGRPEDRAAALAARADEWSRVRDACERGDMTAREAQQARYEIALKVESAYHSGYEKPLELGGAEFLCVCLSYFGGWRGTAKRDFFARLGHTGDEEASNSYAERFENPAKTWASATHRQFSMQAVAVATAKATYRWVANEGKRAMREVLGERERARRHVVTPPTACARPARGSAGDSDEREVRRGAA